MVVFKAVRDHIKENPNLAFAIIGMGMLLTSASSYRLNALVGIYAVEFSLVARHALAAMASLILFVLFGNTKNGVGTLPVQAKRAAAALSAVMLAACIFAKYSPNIMVVSSDWAMLLGRVFEEAVSVVFIVLWADRIIGQGLEKTLLVLGGSACTMGLLQLVLSLFQRIPCMFALAVLPLASLACYFSYSDVAVKAPAKSTVPRPGFDWPLNLHPAKNLFKFLGMLFCLTFVIGQLLYPSLEVQRFEISAQVSIALGNLVAGCVALALVCKVGDALGQPRLTLLFTFFSIFALVALALTLRSLLNPVTVTLYLATSSVVWRLTVCLVWLVCFSRRGPRLTPLSALSVGYATFCAARTLSVLAMMFDAPDSQGIGLQTLAMLAGALVLSFLVVFCAPGAVVMFSSDQAEEENEGGAFKQAVQRLGAASGLTAQETKVLFLVAKGNNAKKTGEVLQVSTNTVKSHMRSVYAKLGVHSQQEVVDMVFAEYGRIKHPK